MILADKAWLAPITAWLAPVAAWLAPIARVVARLADRCLILVARAAVQLGWRTLAACCGVLSAGWIASAAPDWINASPGGAIEAAAQPLTAAARPEHERSAPARRPEWIAVQRPMASFALGLPDLGGQQIRHRSRRDLHSPQREEQIMAGGFTVDAAYAAITVRTSVPAGRHGFFVDMTRSAADAGLAVTRAATPVAAASKFGLIETADMILDAGSESRACIGFRHVAEGAAFSFQGWLCGGKGRAADRQQLTCLIDRLNLVGSGEDRSLRNYFSKAELNRQPGCLSPKLAAAGRRTTWLDGDQAAPQLRRSGG